MYFYKAFAKINLSLLISEKRANSLHEVSSIFQEISYCDDLYIKEIPEKTLKIVCADLNYPCNQQNGLYKIYSYFKKKLECGFEIVVFKKIPMGAGLGGASSQMAVFLKFLYQHYSIVSSLEDLKNLSCQFGSDIPFFFDGGQAYVSGFGEKIEPSIIYNHAAYILFLPNISLKTPAVYHRFDQLVRQHKFNDALSVPMGHNDLLIPALDLAPSLKILLDSIEDICHKPLYMSGSGSTFFMAFQVLEEAQQVYSELLPYQNDFSMCFCHPRQ